MKYMLLIYHNESESSAMSEAEGQASIQAYFALNGQLEASGEMVAGDALYPTGTSTTVAVRESNMIVSDGPFAETKEQLGGYYIVDVESIERAHEIAALIPDAKHGRVEVRQIVSFE